METTDTFTADPARLSAAAVTATDISARLGTLYGGADPVIPPVVPQALQFSEALTTARRRQGEAAGRFAGFYRASATALGDLADAVTDRETTAAARFSGMR